MRACFCSQNVHGVFRGLMQVLLSGYNKKLRYTMKPDHTLISINPGERLSFLRNPL